jgi:hypothetical protein
VRACAFVCNCLQGETPQTISVYAFDDLVDSVVPGDRVLVTGVYRAVPYKPNPRQSTLSSVFKTHLDALHFKKMESSRLTGEDAPSSTDEYKRVYGEGDVTEAAQAARWVPASTHAPPHQPVPCRCAVPKLLARVFRFRAKSAPCFVTAL